MNGECEVTLKFDGEDPISRMAASRVVHATDAYLALTSVRESLKIIRQIEDDEAAMEMFNDILWDYNINLEELP